jgi:hypothetical protein
LRSKIKSQRQTIYSQLNKEIKRESSGNSKNKDSSPSNKIMKNDNCDAG